MILATVGMQLGFDRLIRALDMLAPDLDQHIIAQTGKGTYQPQNMRHQPQFPHAQMEQLFAQAQLIIGHAGIGTILAARRHSKPIIILPRRADLDEHRNDHQLATAQYLQGRMGITIIQDCSELADAIAHAMAQPAPDAAPPPQLHDLQQAVAIFIKNGRLTAR